MHTRNLHLELNRQFPHSSLRPKRRLVHNPETDDSISCTGGWDTRSVFCAYVLGYPHRPRMIITLASTLHVPQSLDTQWSSRLAASEGAIAEGSLHNSNPLQKIGYSVPVSLSSTYHF